MRVLFTVLLLATCALPALPDAVVLKTGERFLGEVKDEGDSLRIRNERFPDGVVVKKSDVKAVYPRVEEMLSKLDGAIGKARERYEAGKSLADANAEMKAVGDILFDAELEASDGGEIYPDRKKDFEQRVEAIHDLKKLARDAQTLGGPPVEPKKDPNPKPAPKPVPRPDPAPAPADYKERATVWLAGPADASAADLEKAAKAMVARCGAAGLKGVKAKTEAWPDGVTRVRLDVEDGFSKEMVQSVATMGRFAAKAFEMRLAYFPTKTENEQYIIPRDDELASAKAPGGAKWLKRVRFNAEGPDAPRPASLVRNSPVVARTEMLPPEKDKPESAADFYVLNAAAAKRLQDALQAGGTFRCVIAVDDVILVS
ncbi:MAG: hypothetical protein K8T20_02745, partial [Planctomycetes bacterium]|nr:hypothetical protein [Planctomycetota bacterium]